MAEVQKSKQYDLEERTFEFARKVRFFVQRITKTISNLEDAKQLIRSSGSVGANYIEANEALSKKDFAMRIKICRKEAKESIFWLKLLSLNSTIEQERLKLIDECTQLMKIFGAIISRV